jgi:peptidyl-prolyl cis-trans isomerase D
MSSPLERLRSATDSTGTRLLIGGLMLLFVFFLGNGPSSSKSRGGAGGFATVNGESITESEFQQRFRSEAGRRGGQLSQDELKKLQVEVLDSMETEEALVQKAESMGLDVSDEEIARVLLLQEGFKKDGKFDQKTYERALKSMGQTPASFEMNVKRGLLLEKLDVLVNAAVSVSEAEVKAAWIAQGTQVDLTFVRVPVTAFLDDVSVTDGEVQALLTSSEADVKKRYDESFERLYNLPKRYSLRTILFRTDTPDADKAAIRAKADDVARQAASGADFATLAEQYSEDLSAAAGGALGRLGADQLDPVLVTAADAAGAGKVTSVVETGRGFQILQVEAIEDAKIVKWEDARVEVATAMLKDKQAPDLARDYAGKIIAAWTASGQPPRELTEPRKLAVDTTGPFPVAETEIPILGSVPELTAAIARAASGTVLPMAYTAGGAQVVVAVTSRTEPTEDSFAADAGPVRARLLLERRMAFAQVWRTEVRKKAKIERLVTF